MKSKEFRDNAARHSDSGQFTRKTKLCLPRLISALLGGARSGVQIGLDLLVDRLGLGDQISISAGALTHGRNKLHPGSLGRLNEALLQKCEEQGFIHRYKGLRIVAGDASDLRLGIRASWGKVQCAPKNMKLFALYLPGSELTLHAQLHHCDADERQMLVEQLDRLGPNDLLVLDRGFPAAWLVHMLNERGIKFLIRADACGFKSVNRFAAGSMRTEQAKLRAPTKLQAELYEVPRTRPKVRLIRHVSSVGGQRIFITNLPEQDLSIDDAGGIYHQRWRIEEAFKRLKTKACLESPSGLTEHAIRLDMMAKVIADNLNNLACAQIIAVDPLRSYTTEGQQISRSAAYSLSTQHLFCLLCAPIERLLRGAEYLLRTLAKHKVRILSGRSTPRPKTISKHHRSMAYKSV